MVHGPGVSLLVVARASREKTTVLLGPSLRPDKRSCCSICDRVSLKETVGRLCAR
jgi:hypothetical protein